MFDIPGRLLHVGTRKLGPISGLATLWDLLHLPLYFAEHNPFTGALKSPHRQRIRSSIGSITQLVFCIVLQSAWLVQLLATTVKKVREREKQRERTKLLLWGLKIVHNERCAPQWSLAERKENPNVLNSVSRTQGEGVGDYHAGSNDVLLSSPTKL